MALTGVNFVRFSRHGLQAGRHWWPRAAPRFELRRHVLKLRFWDERHEHPPGIIMDLSYEGIKSLAGERIYEVRVDDEIGGHENIRILMYDPPTDLVPYVDHPVVDGKVFRSVWVLEAMPKRRDGWTTNEIDRFRRSAKMIRLRCYEDS